MAHVASRRTEPWRPVWSEALGIGVQAPAGLREEVSAPDHLVLLRPATTAAEFETLQLSRHRQRGGDTPEGWNRALAHMAADGLWHDVLLSPLQRYPVADFGGLLSLLRFTDGAGVGTVAALWCGQVDDETVTLLYRCGLAREVVLSVTVGTLLNTLSFVPRNPVRGPMTRSRSGVTPPSVVFGASLVIAVVLILLGVILQAR